MSELLRQKSIATRSWELVRFDRFKPLKAEGGGVRLPNGFLRGIRQTRQVSALHDSLSTSVTKQGLAPRLRSSRPNHRHLLLRQMKQDDSPDETANMRRLRQDTHAIRNSRSTPSETGIAVQVAEITEEIAPVLFVLTYLNNSFDGQAGGKWTR